MVSFPKYDSYKPSGVEWLGDIPSHWDSFALKRAVSTKITDGPHETPVFYDSGIPFVSVEAVENGRINLNKARGFISVIKHLEYSSLHSALQKSKTKPDFSLADKPSIITQGQ